MQIRKIPMIIVFVSLALLAESGKIIASEIEFDFIFTTEFKDAEVARLLALPPEAVPLMSDRLATMSDEDPNRHRLVSGIARKLKQKDLHLPLEIRLKALAALKGKYLTVNKAKQDLILSIESELSKAIAQSPDAKTNKKHEDVVFPSDATSNQIEFAPVPHPEHKKPLSMLVRIGIMLLLLSVIWLVIKKADRKI